MTNQPHILIVDDNRSFRDELKTYLTKHGFRVSLAEGTQAAREALKNNTIDLLLMDVMVSGVAGLSLCSDIRESSSTPIILLTAMDDMTDKIIGLEICADDYMSKPVNTRELLARIKAVLRRTSTAATQVKSTGATKLKFGRWTLDQQKQVLNDDKGTPVTLSSGEFALLNILVQRPGTVLSRDQLLDLTQGRRAEVFDRSIDNQISRLRKKIEDEPRTPSLIKTHWGGGYSLAAEVTSL